MVVKILVAGYTPAVQSDIGKAVVNGNGSTLAWFDNTTGADGYKTWWVKGATTIITTGASLSISGGTGVGTTFGSSYVDSSLSFVNPVGTDSSVQNNYLLMPWVYFKFVNIDPTAYQSNSSKIIIDNVLFKQLNSASKLYY